MVLIISLLIAITFAEPGPACHFKAGTNKIPVIFFGGYGSTPRDVNEWAHSAQSTSHYERFYFEGNSLHKSGLSKASVLNASAQDIDNCVKMINSNQFKGPIVIVGHSHGSLVINKIVEKTNPQNRSKIQLVNLDGYKSTGPIFKNVKVQCWTSYSPSSQPNPPESCADILPKAKSRGTDSMKQCSGTCHVMRSPTCGSNVWCRHFALVNRGASPNLGDANLNKAYANVDPPLDFLNPILETAPNIQLAEPLGQKSDSVL